MVFPGKKMEKELDYYREGSWSLVDEGERNFVQAQAQSTKHNHRSCL
jgi:hypothetical protein